MLKSSRDRKERGVPWLRGWRARYVNLDLFILGGSAEAVRGNKIG